MSYCTCKMRSPSRIRPSLAAMLFGLICEDRRNKRMSQTLSILIQESHRVPEKVLTHYVDIIQLDMSRLLLTM